MLWTAIFGRNTGKIYLISYNFMGKHAFWTASFQCLAKSLITEDVKIWEAFVLLLNFLTAALTCEQARGRCARNRRGDCEGSRATPFPIPPLNRVHSGYNSILILFFLPRPNKGYRPFTPYNYRSFVAIG